MSTITIEECEESVSHPGKFEGEARYVPYFWDGYLHGFSDWDDGRILGFNLTEHQRTIFPELGLRKTIKLIEDDNGFVREVI
jgi:hypothetical protein